MLGEIYAPWVVTRLTWSRLRHLFEARWVVRARVDTQLRIRLRSDLDLVSAESDLFHPQRYAEPVSPAVQKREAVLW